MFRILSFTMHKHPLLGGKVFELANPKEDKVSNYYSIIIGPNGTGKSYLLSNLLEAFNEIVLLKTIKDYKPRKKFTLEYNLGGHKFTISTEKKTSTFKRGDNPILVSEIEFPTKWLASSVTINDKYPVLNYLRKKQLPEYKYLGIRSASNNAFISRITINTVIYFIEALQKGKAANLLSVYDALGLNSELQIVFVGGPMLKLGKKDSKYMLPDNIDKILEPHRTFLKENKTKTNYRADNYKKHLDNDADLKLVTEFMLLNREKFEKSTKSAMQLKYGIDLRTEFGIKDIEWQWSYLSILLDLELIKISKFHLTKDSPFKYEEASSGEGHLLTSFHGIIANLEDNSLLVIDEPEISLHPNWQIEYFEILKKIVNSYKNVFTVIATHSNLLVSSLKNEESRITSIRRDGKTKEIVIDELDYETYGWDPERILYKIFGLVTQRNNYFESDLRTLIALISSKDSDIKEVVRLYGSLKKYILADKDDPLKIIISRAESYISEHNV